MGRGQHDHHQAIRRDDPLEESAIPSLSLDYCFLGDGQVRAARNPILVVFDNKTTMLGARQTYVTGPVDWIVKEVAAFISMIGYGQVRVTLKSDGEASIVALKMAIASKRDGPTTLIQTPARESKCNGTMEARVKNWQSQFRTVMFDLRKCTGRKVPLLCKTTSWLTQLAATVPNKYKLDRSGRTLYQRITNVHQRRPIAKFEEKILFMLNGKRDQGLKGDSIMHEGIFLGLRNHGVEALIAIGEDVVSARTIRRKPVEERWSANEELRVRISAGSTLNDGEVRAEALVPMTAVKSEETQDIHQREEATFDEQVVQLRPIQTLAKMRMTPQAQYHQ